MTSHELGTIMTKLRVVASRRLPPEGACKYGKRAPGADKQVGGDGQTDWADREGAMHVVNALKCKNIWEIK